MTNAHEREPKPEIGKQGHDTEKKEWTDVPTEGLQEILPSEDELDRVHQEKISKLPPSEVQKIIDELNKEDAEQKKHEDDVDAIIRKKSAQGN